MERLKKEKKHRKKAPRVPIKTYKWEDIRRARLKGGYPWTYLYKEPFKEYIESKIIKMDPSPKSRSSSSLQKPTEGVEIKEVTNGVDEHLTIPEPSSYIVITEVPSDSENHSKKVVGGSVIIEDMEEPETLNLESAESSDNISQYLDKEEPVPEPTQVTQKNGKTEEATTSQNDRQERAKSEEPKRKRKLSVDSSYSRKSLSKLAIMKKIKEAKDKIKVPKLSLPKSLKPQKSNKEEKKKEEKPEEIKQYIHNPKSNEKPVYIHIPLKPPEGQSDEFSYLEFGEKKPEEQKESKEEKELKEEKDLKEEIASNEEKQSEKPTLTNESNQITIAIEPPPPDDPSDVHDDQRRYSEHPDDIVAIEILKTQDIDYLHASRNGLNELCVLQPEGAPHNSDIMIYLPAPDEAESSLERTPSKKKGPSRQGSKKIRAKSAEPERRSATPVRAKSAEPERKRKLSLESSYSSFSLSKQGILKRIKDARDKLKFPKLSGLSLRKEQAKKPKEESVPKETKTEAPKTESTSAGPKYIHIPLKPPEGQSDEFSYLEFEEKEEKPDKQVESQEKEKEKEEETSLESPTSAQDKGVQFIFLTPPSDDEILDKPDVPETPSSENKDLIRINELKEIAQDAVDKVSPESRRKKLPIETEETEKPKEPEPTSEKVEKMVVDEEDGLKLTESAMAKQEQNIKAKEFTEPLQELKCGLKADGLKKKVSFKRRSRDDSKDGIYEDVQAPTDDKAKEKKEDAAEEAKSTLAAMGNSQSMSVDEEKSYLDEKKIIKTTSLEEDYNRWSKLSDHEYEPVNPPPDNIVIGSKIASPLPPLQASAPATQAHAPTVHVIDTDQGTTQQKTISLASSTTSLERRMLGAEIDPTPEESFTVQEMQSEIENKFFSKTPQKAPKQTTTVHTSVVSTSKPEKQSSKTEGPGKFQQAIKVQAGKFKTKLHGIKKPNIKLPPKPNLDRFKFEKPKINLPKMPDTSKISLPTFSLPRKNPLKRSLKQRHLSTESNAGGSKTNYFDFRTYPRLFKKKHKDDFDSSFSSKSEREVPEFATVPRTKRSQADDRWGGRDTIRIPLHAEDSVEDHEREDSVERRIAAHMRYEQDIDIDDAYEKENQEIHTASPFSHGYNSRWNHGSFHPQPNLEYREDNRNNQVTDLDSPGDAPAQHESFDTNTSKDIHSSESSLGIHRRGVLEEIDSDEFFLRQKGISQDNIEVGMYLSSEIREAFKSPTNALADLHREPRDFPYEARASNQSLPETPPKRKVIKKPKRKKTPHVSQEQISFDQDSELEAGLEPPSRPRRRSKRSKKAKESETVIPYQETIAVDAPDENETLKNLETEIEEYRAQYENEQMQGKEQPEIKVTDSYIDDFKYEEKYESDEEVFRDEDVFRDEEPAPAAPPRKHRSLKSLNFSEHDSILGDFNEKEPVRQEFEIYKTEHEYIIPTPELPPGKPPRTLSRSSSKSRDHEEAEEAPIRPTRTRSRSRTRADSIANEEPCVEELCVEDFRDSMGYAVIDKQTKREPPLPPPRTPPRRKRTVQSSEQRFFTVPRPLNDEPPMRPLRNYSTLGPSRPPRRRPTINMTDEEKENIDITQYIEIEDEPNRDLISGEVIQKMRDRPLPAPPRPPRNKAKTLQDITSEENILVASSEEYLESELDFEKAEMEETKIVAQEAEALPEESEILTHPAEEAEVSTQTEPLPDDFVCEELVQEPHDKTITPRRPQTAEQPDAVTVERQLITPTHYTYEEETITHGSLVIEPLNGAKILPDSEITRRERTIPIAKDYDDETSEIPEEFTKLKDPPPRTATPQSTQPQVIERIIERPVIVQPDSSTEVEVLKAQKLQVGDLDVDRLSVNELMASKIIVSEIDSGNIQTQEISSKSGALKVGEIELPPSLVQQLFERLQSVAQEQQSSRTAESRTAPESSSKSEESQDSGQKKTPFEEVTVETLPQRPPRKAEEPREPSVTQIDDRIEETPIDVADIQTDSLDILETEEIEETTEPPEPPVRSDSSIEPTESQPVFEPPKEVPEEPEETPQRPPRHAEKAKVEESEEILSEEPVQEQKMEEPEIDDEPPPRPPEPPLDYRPSQPPASFYALRAQQFIDNLEGDIPLAPRRRRHHKPPISRSSSEDSPAPPPSRRRYRSPEPTIPQLTGQLIQACGSAADSSIKRLIAHITDNVLQNRDGHQDMNVIMVILLVLIAGLILLGFGSGKTIHYHHWEYFNPPRDL